VKRLSLVPAMTVIGTASGGLAVGICTHAHTPLSFINDANDRLWACLSALPYLAVARGLIRSPWFTHGIQPLYGCPVGRAPHVTTKPCSSSRTPRVHMRMFLIGMLPRCTPSGGRLAASALRAATPVPEYLMPECVWRNVAPARILAVNAVYGV
jgi:hypothetical protein